MSDIEVTIDKPRRGRPRKNEDDKVKFGREYFNKYYEKTAKKIQCPNCGGETNLRNISMHKKSIKCQFKTIKKNELEQKN